MLFRDEDQSGEMTREEWIVGIFKKNLCYLFGIPPERFAIDREEFQIMLETYGYSKYEANEIFYQMDIDASGTITGEEIFQYRDHLRQKLSFWTKWEMPIMFVQFFYAVTSSMNFWFVEESFFAKTERFFLTMTTMGSLFLFLHLVYSDQRRTYTLVQTLQVFEQKSADDDEFDLSNYMDKTIRRSIFDSEYDND